MKNVHGFIWLMIGIIFIAIGAILSPFGNLIDVIGVAFGWLGYFFVIYSIYRGTKSIIKKN